jgi:hypothetical protein
MSPMARTREIMPDAIELAIFDIDGPVTDPESREIKPPDILDLTLDFLAEKGYVAYNTGRGWTITRQRVIRPLLRRARERGMNRAIVARRTSIFAEKGGVSSRWDDERGGWDHRVDPAAEVPGELRAEIFHLLHDDPEFLKYIFFDAGKETMISVEMRYETAEPVPVPVTIDAFKPVAGRFAARVRQLAADRGYDDLEVDHSTIAVDIQRRAVGKDLGARLAFGWLSELGQRVTRVHCFGDSASDVAMAVEAHSLMSQSFADAAERVVYVNVGRDLIIEGDFEVRSYPDMYGEGTAAYLRSLP